MRRQVATYLDRLPSYPLEDMQCKGSRSLAKAEGVFARDEASADLPR